MVAIRIKFGPQGSVKTFQTFPDNARKIEHSFGKDLSHSAEESKKRGAEELDDVQATKKQKLECDWSSQCLTLLSLLMEHRHGWVFNMPVDPVKLKIPDYFSVITNPMDLGTIKSKLFKNEYGNADEFAGDVRLTFANAMRYNPPGNPVHKTAKEIKEVFEVRWELLKKKKFSKVSGTEVTEGFNMPLLECDWSSQCLTLLSLLMEHRLGWVFNMPVDPVKLKIPDYFSVITNPMDLGTIRSKLLKNEYGNADEFAGDVRLTFANTMRYNPPGNLVHKTAKEIKEVFEVRWELLKKKKFSKVSGTEVTEGFKRKSFEDVVLGKIVVL